MKKNKVIFIISMVASWILSNIMCIDVTYRWVRHMYNTLNSAPAWVNIIFVIPYLIIIAMLQIIGSINYKKIKNNKD